MPIKAVILVGGPSRGTRFRPLSLNVPKPLFPIAGHPVIYHHIAALARLPDLSEVLIVGFFKDVVFAGFINDVKREFGINVRYLREYQALGTAGGLFHFRDEILRGNPSHFFVLHADVCSSFPLADMLAFHKNHQGLCTILGTKVARDLVHKYGCLVAKPNSTSGEVMHYVEKPETFVSDLISCGVYIFSTTRAFEEIRRALDNRNNAMGLPHGLDDDVGQSPTTAEDDEHNTVVRLEQDLLRPLAADGKLFVFETKDFWRQIKTAGSAVPANALYLEQQVKLNSPAIAQNTPDGPEIVGAVWIDPSAKVDPSAKIGPNVSIGPGCVIGSGVRVRDSIILDNVEVKTNALIVHAVVGWDSKIGNWTRVEGSLPSAYNSAITQNGRKVEGATILGKEVAVADEVIIRNCIVLPNKELRNSCHSEILM